MRDVARYCAGSVRKTAASSLHQSMKYICVLHVSLGKMYVKAGREGDAVYTKKAFGEPKPKQLQHALTDLAKLVCIHFCTPVVGSAGQWILHVMMCMFVNV